MTDLERTRIRVSPFQAGMPTPDEVTQAVRLGLTPDLEAARERGRRRAEREIYYGIALGAALSDVIEAEQAFASNQTPTIDDARIIVDVRLSFIGEAVKNLARPYGSIQHNLGREAMRAYAGSLVGQETTSGSVPVVPKRSTEGGE